MNAKEYLRQLIWMDKRINALLERKERYNDFACRATGTVNATRYSGTGQRSNVDEYVCKLIDLESDINRQIDQFVDQTREAERIISFAAGHSSPGYPDMAILEWMELGEDFWDYGLCPNPYI